MKLLKFLIVLFIAITGPFHCFALASLIPSSVNESPQIALLLGASVYIDSPTPVTQARLESAITFLQQNPENRVLLSGWKTNDGYDEVRVMREFLLEKGISADQILSDDQSVNTYSSCKRAYYLYKIRSAYIITQPFHLPRATFLCRNVGISVIPLDAKSSGIQSIAKATMREIPASWIALISLLFDIF